MSSLLHYVADLAPQRAVGRVHEAYDVVVAGVGAGHGCEFFGRYMIGHEYKNRAAEPLFAAEAFEKEAECVVVVSHALVDFGVAVGQRVFVSGGYDERMVRREGEERGEEGFRGFGKAPRP